MKAIIYGSRVISLESDAAILRDVEQGVEVAVAGEVERVIGGVSLADVLIINDVDPPAGIAMEDLRSIDGAVAARSDYAEILAHRAAMLADARAKRWSEIKTERDRRKAGGVLVAGHWFHSDDPSRTQYGILDSKALRAGWTDAVVIHPKWKTMESNPDGSPIYTAMTVALLRQILDAGIVQEAALFDKAEQHRLAMEASTDPASYDSSTGWPLIYGE